MSFLRRAMMMGGKKLPYDAQVEYLACTGAGEKINTLINPTNKTRVYAKVMFTAAYSVLFCSRWIDNNTNTFAFYNASSNLMAMADHDGTQHRAYPLTSDNRRLNNELVVDFDVSTAKVYLNDTAIASSTLNRGTFTSTEPIILFNLIDAYKAIAKIYWCKIYENGAMVRDFIPVRVGTTGYMYDKVSGQLFGNAGTGSFTLGNDI